MTPMQFWNALELPKECLRKEVIPKRLLMEHGCTSPGDRNLLQQGIGEVRWFANLKPSFCGIPAFASPERSIEEIQCIQITLKNEQKVDRIVEIVHRAMPYPLVLGVQWEEVFWVSMASKRNSQGAKEAWVLEHEPWIKQVTPEDCSRFSLSLQDRGNLWTLYQSWLSQLQFAILAVHGADAERLRELETQVESLRKQARKAPSLKERAEHNLHLDCLLAEAERIKTKTAPSCPDADSSTWLRPLRERLDHALHSKDTTCTSKLRGKCK